MMRVLYGHRLNAEAVTLCHRAHFGRVVIGQHHGAFDGCHKGEQAFMVYLIVRIKPLSVVVRWRRLSLLFSPNNRMAILRIQ